MQLFSVLLGPIRLVLTGPSRLETSELHEVMGVERFLSAEVEISTIFLASGRLDHLWPIYE